jgi:hypothetical protein
MAAVSVSKRSIAFQMGACALAPACDDNAIVQAVATGHVKNLVDGREALQRPVQFDPYFRAQIGTWQGAFERYQSVVGKYRNLEHETTRV